MYFFHLKTFGVVFFCMILLQVHFQVYVNGKLLNLEKATRRQVVSISSSTKEGGIPNDMNETLIALANILSARKHLAIHLLWAISQLLVIRVSLIYLVDEFFFIFSFSKK